MQCISNNAMNLLSDVQAISEQFASERAGRQKCRNLSKSDFDALATAGFLSLAVPTEFGGLWQSPAQSLRTVCQCLRTLGHGDSSVALVAAMHPTVLASWLGSPSAPGEFNAQWQKQRREIFEGVRNGAWWGTITSEPGSAGDITKTKTQASRVDASLTYELTGKKHFGSGLGIVSYMVTTALPEGELEPDLFFLDVRDVPLDGSTGARLMAEWDGHGMIATQSHAVTFEKFRATRVAWQGNLSSVTEPVKMVSPCLFTSVIVGIVETAFAEARLLIERRDSVTSYERVEWTKALMQEWLLKQAYAGMLTDVESNNGKSTLIAKTAISELAESALSRLCKILGGGTYSRQSPFGFWAQDVCALGFLRPPWALAYDLIYAE
jgi:alkylation response protein AidB-like acyl-CoA dehydrogenase